MHTNHGQKAVYICGCISVCVCFCCDHVVGKSIGKVTWGSSTRLREETAENVFKKMEE